MKGVEDDLPHAWILNGFDQLLSDFQSWKAGKERDALLYASDDSNMVDEALPDNEPHRKYSPEEWEALVEVGRKKYAGVWKKDRALRSKRKSQILKCREVFENCEHNDLSDAKHEATKYFMGAIHRAVREVFDSFHYFSLHPEGFTDFVSNFAGLEKEDCDIFRNLLVKLQVYNNALMALKDKDWVNSEGDIYPFTTE